MKKCLLLCSTLFLLSSCNIFYTPSSSSSNSESVSDDNSSSLSLSTSQKESSTTSNSPSSSILLSTSSSIEEIAVSDISLPSTTIEMKINKTVQLNAKVLPNNATNQTLTYTSLQPNIASVDQKGNIKALQTGTATIQVKSHNGITKNVTISISLNDLPSLSEKTFNVTTAPYYGNEYFYTKNLNPKTTTIANGVTYTYYNYVGVDGSAAKGVYTITVDLNLATITVGTSSNSYFPKSAALLKDQANAFESQTMKKVYAAVNGDYFGAYSGYNSNGFVVKEGVVVSAKSAFYENLVNGMMALSISYNDVATIAKSAPNSSTFYRVDNYVELYDINAKKVSSGLISAIDNQDVLDMHAGTRPRNYEVVTKNNRSVTNQNVLYVTKTKSYQDVGSIRFPFDGRISLIQKNYTGTISLKSDQVALLVPSTFANQATLNHQVRVGVTTSDSSAFSNVKTIIGGRHNLIDNYKIVNNLADENTNDATKKRARTCVGILGDGKVMLMVCEDGTKGLNLVSVADFMRYLGCRYAFNLDGGGSTGLLVRENNTLNLKAGKNTRKLANTVLVVEK